MRSDHGDADKLIASINMEELYVRRRVRGRDLNDWHNQLAEWEHQGAHYAALELLHEVMDTVEGLDWLDAREPQLYWFDKAARMMASQGRHDDAAVTLRRWLACWPDHRAEAFTTRAGLDSRRAAVRERADRLEVLAAGRGAR